jgi:hypothetical protein
VPFWTDLITKILRITQSAIILALKMAILIHLMQTHTFSGFLNQNSEFLNQNSNLNQSQNLISKSHSDLKDFVDRAMYDWDGKLNSFMRVTQFNTV